MPRVSLSLWNKSDARSAVDTIIEAESMGIGALWTDVGRSTPDPVTFLAAALWATKSIQVGIGIVPTFPRHPAVLANQAQSLYQIGGDRTRLGVGPSHAHIIHDAYGLPFDRPLEHLREYLTVLRALLTTGTCQFSGDHYTVDVTLSEPAPLPIYMSALRPKAMRLAGELADGVLTWLSPIDYLHDVSIPALDSGAAVSNRQRPQVVGAWPCVVSEDPDVVWDAVGPMMSVYANLPFYKGVLEAAGITVPTGRWSIEALDRVVFWGSPERIDARIQDAHQAGIDEVSLHVYAPHTVTAAEIHQLATVWQSSTP
ncbi:MAG: LLM class flavin-dependent oxidoreductase [Thermomicrobiales bacterium]|nr:LLM class flavin-dependent oxidoreductase [Thermomicrobiales bacterium]